MLRPAPGRSGGPRMWCCFVARLRRRDQEWLRRSRRRRLGLLGHFMYRQSLATTGLRPGGDPITERYAARATLLFAYLEAPRTLDGYKQAVAVSFGSEEDVIFRGVDECDIVLVKVH